MSSIPWVRYAFVVLLTSSSNINGLLVPPYLRDRGYDYTAIGMLVAIIGIASLASRFPAGTLYRRDRSRLISTVAIAGLGAAYLLYPLAGDSVSFSLIQVLVGLSSGVATTTNLATFMDLIPRSVDRPKAMSFFASALAGGHALGNLVGGFAGDLLGYASAFQMGAAMTVCALIFLWLDRQDIAESELTTRSKQSAPASLSERFSGALRAMTEPRIVVISLVAFLLNFLHGMISTFFPLYGVAIGLSLSEIGVLKSVHALVNTVVRPLAGAPIRALGAERVSVFGLAGMAVLDALLPTQSLTFMFAILLAAIGLVRAIVLVANTVELATVDETRISRGLSSSLFSSSQDLGMLTSPALCGVIASVIGLTSMMMIVPIASAGLFFVAVATQSRRQRQQTTAPSV